MTRWSYNRAFKSFSVGDHVEVWKLSKTWGKKKLLYDGVITEKLANHLQELVIDGHTLNNTFNKFRIYPYRSP